MSVYIQNISEDRGLTYGSGEQVYILGINNLKFVEFSHNFEDGLSSCLRTAADALDILENNGEMKIFEKERLEYLKKIFEENQ